MNAVGARFDPDVHDRAVSKAILRLGHLLGAELLYGVDGNEGTGISPVVNVIQNSRARSLGDSRNAFQPKEIVLGVAAIGSGNAGTGSGAGKEVALQNAEVAKLADAQP